MKTALLTVSIVAALAIVATSGQAANPPQSGSNGDCVDFNVLYLGPVRSPGAATVVVAGGTNYTISSDGGTAFVDFYDADGDWQGWNGGAASGVTPSGAVSGTICVGLLGDYPDAPAPLTTWTYQDGL